MNFFSISSKSILLAVTPKVELEYWDLHKSFNNRTPLLYPREPRKYTFDEIGAADTISTEPSLLMFITLHFNVVSCGIPSAGLSVEPAFSFSDVPSPI